MAQPFNSLRRQQFMRETYAAEMKTGLGSAITLFTDGLTRPDNDTEDMRRLSWGIADTGFDLFCLRYTAGEPIEPLREELEKVVAAYELHQRYLGEHSGAPNVSPLRFFELDEYERALQLISLSILLKRPDLIDRLAALFDPGYRGEDTIYEDLLAFYQGDRIDLDEWYHDKPYDLLVNAMYLEKEAAADQLDKYVTSWYPCFSYAPWHDTHLQMRETEGAYFGYWAFEAAAVAYLYELDDSKIDHMVYPRDLVDFARNFDPGTSQEDDPQRGRCEAGQPCPREGFWFTPAQLGSRRYFKAGEVMPAVISDYGLTIWQWDTASQNPAQS